MGMVRWMVVCAWVVLMAASADGGPARAWKTLEGCRLAAAPGNDGDSFHVLHGGKEYIFRLCFVDAPETGLAFKERVEEQAAYFGIGVDDALRIGESAAAFTTRFLKDGFTVRTKFEDAKGASELARFYAFVVAGEADLSEALVENGLARVYGYMPNLPDGSPRWEHRARLKRAEAAAKRGKQGGWGVAPVKRKKPARVVPVEAETR